MLMYLNYIVKLNIWLQNTACHKACSMFSYLFYGILGSFLILDSFVSLRVPPAWDSERQVLTKDSIILSDY